LDPQTPDEIEILFYGGIVNRRTRLDRSRRKPIQRLWIALSGSNESQVLSDIPLRGSQGKRHSIIDFRVSKLTLFFETMGILNQISEMARVQA
jgi:hypothetical protein